MSLANLLVLISLLIVDSSFAQKPADEGLEAYSIRPKIESLRAKGRKDLGKRWEKLRPAHLEFVVQIAEIYPDREIVFLARDGELFYDTAKILYANEPKQLKRFHLLNVSSASIRSKNLKPYLVQNGISDEALLEGRRFLFMDSGFNGSIPKVISKTLSLANRGHNETHLVLSTNREHPSSRSFLTYLDQKAAKKDPTNFRDHIIGYEFMPRFTERAIDYKMVNGNWAAVSQKKGFRTIKPDGRVAPRDAKRCMEDLKYYLQSDEAQKLFKKRRKVWQKLYQMRKDEELLVSYMLQLLRKDSKRNEAVVRDFIEAIQRNTISGPDMWLTPSHVGLSATDPRKTTTGYSNFLDVLEESAELRPFLNQPYENIPELLHRNSFEILDRLRSEVDDRVFQNLFYDILGAQEINISREYIIHLMSEGDPDVLASLMYGTFKVAEGGSKLEFLERLVAMTRLKKGHELLPIMVKATSMWKVNRGSTHLLDEVFERILRENDSELMASMAKTITLSYPPEKWESMAIKLIRKAFESQNDAILSNLSVYTFSNPASKNMSEGAMELIRGIYETKDFTSPLRFLVEKAFSQMHLDNLPRLIEFSIENHPRPKEISYLLDKLTDHVFRNTLDSRFNRAVKISIAKMIQLGLDESLSKLQNAIRKNSGNAELGRIADSIGAYRKGKLEKKDLMALVSKQTNPLPLKTINFDSPNFSLTYVTPTGRQLELLSAHTYEIPQKSWTI